MKATFTLSLFISLLIRFSVCAQTEIKGVLKDAETSEPLPFGHITIAECGIGTVSNLSGQFSFRIPESCTAHSVTFSFLGYQSQEIALNSIETDQEISLKPTENQLQEVVVMPLTPRQIVDKAFENIPKNYPNQDLLLTAFYYDSRYIDTTFFSKSESVLNILKKDYSRSKKDKMAIVKGRNLPSPDTTLTFPNLTFSSSMTALMELDLAANPKEFRKFFNEKTQFVLEKVTYFEEELVYEISFGKNDPEANSAGKLVIHADSYAFLQLQKASTEKGLAYANKHSISGSMKEKTIAFLVNYSEINYRKWDGKWYPFMAVKEVDLRYENQKTGFYGNLKFEARMVVTEISEDISRFPKKGKVKSGEVSYQKAADFYDENFWSNFNRIEVEQAEKELLQKSMATE